MGPARLTGALLARKGDAAPIRGAYGGTILEPLPGLFGNGVVRAAPQPGADDGAAAASAPAVAVRRVATVAAALRGSATTPPADTARVSLRLAGEQLTRLRILAARRGRRPQQLLREALEAVFAGTSDACPCVRGADETCCKDPPPVRSTP